MTDVYQFNRRESGSPIRTFDPTPFTQFSNPTNANDPLAFRLAGSNILSSQFNNAMTRALQQHQLDNEASTSFAREQRTADAYGDLARQDKFDGLEAFLLTQGGLNNGQFNPGLGDLLSQSSGLGVAERQTDIGKNILQQIRDGFGAGQAPQFDPSIPAAAGIQGFQDVTPTSVRVAETGGGSQPYVQDTFSDGTTTTTIRRPGQGAVETAEQRRNSQDEVLNDLPRPQREAIADFINQINNDLIVSAMADDPNSDIAAILSTVDIRPERDPATDIIYMVGRVNGEEIFRVTSTDIMVAKAQGTMATFIDEVLTGKR